jgi:O-antigen ligase
MVQVAKGKGKIVAIVIVAGLGATIAKTGSRGGFLGLIAFGIATLLLLKTVPVAKRVLFLFVTAIALSIAAPPGYWTQMETILSPKQDYNWNSPTGRREVFKRGIGYMMRNPVTGIGIQNFPRAEGTLSERAQLQAANPESYAGIKWSVAHNSFLEVASETGLVGITCYLTLVIGSIIIAGRLRRKMPKSWVRGTEEERFLYYATLYLPIAFITFCVSGFFVSFSYHDLIYLMGSVMAGLILCVNQKLHGPVGHPAPGAVVTPLVTPRRTMPPGPSLRFPQPPGGPVA